MCLLASRCMVAPAPAAAGVAQRPRPHGSCVRIQAGLAGALGLTAGLLLETFLLIIRSNRPEPLEDRMPHLFDTAKVNEAFARVRQMKQQQAGKAAKPGGAAAQAPAPAASSSGGARGGSPSRASGGRNASNSSKGQAAEKKIR